LPTGRVVVVMVTVPVVGFTVPEPRAVPPLVIVIVPVVPGGTVAVIVTGLPYVLDPEVVTTTVGVALLTIWVRVAVAVLSLVSPLYVAVIVLDPNGKVVLLTAATPLIKVEVPSTFDPLVKVTVPVALEGTTAVKTTNWFAADGLIDEESASIGVALVTVCVVVPVAGLLFVSPP
jgi:hypothetical protein